MRFGKLKLGLGNLGGGPAPVPPPVAPTDIAWSGTHTIAENSPLGSIVGGALSATHPNPNYVVFSITDANFGADGTSIIVTGVPDYEVATSHQITVRADDRGSYFEKVFTVTVTDVTEDPPPPDEEPPPGVIIIDDPIIYEHPPVVTEIDNGIAFHGKKKTGSTGKFIYDMGLPAAGQTYTVLYDPDWSLLENGGVTAFFGFGIRHGNDFHLMGLKGNGSTGLLAYIVYGDNLWNQTSGFTTINGGTAAFGTQGGPNWLQLEISSDLSTYTLRTGPDRDTWTDEFTDQLPSPFTGMGGNQLSNFGLAAFLEANDAGPFRVDITLFTGDVAPHGIVLSENYVYETTTRTTIIGTLTTEGGTSPFTYTMEG